MEKLSRRKYVTNVPRKLSEEHSHKYHFLPGKSVPRKSFPTNFLDFSEKILIKKVSSSTTFRSWIHDFFVDLLAACPNIFFYNRRSFVVQEGPLPRHAEIHTAVCARMSWYGQRLADPQPYREAPHRSSVVSGERTRAVCAIFAPGEVASYSWISTAWKTC